MTRRIRSRMTFANTTSLLALFIALGGTSYAVTQITGADVQDGSLTGADVRDGSLTRADQAQPPRASAVKRGRRGPRGRTGRGGRNGLPGAQGLPGGLGATGANGAPGGNGAPGATGPSIGRSAVDQVCNADTTGAPETCATLSLTLPSSGRVLLIGAGNWETDGTLSRGTCQFTADGTNLPGAVARPGHQTNPSTGSVTQSENQMSLTTVTEVLPAGAHTFTVACTESVADIDWDDVQLSAVALGPQ